MQEYIKTMLVNLLVLFICGNILIALTPRWIRKMLVGTITIFYKSTKWICVQASGLFKYLCKNFKEIYGIGKEKRTTPIPKQSKKVVNGDNNVIPFPQRK